MKVQVSSYFSQSLTWYQSKGVQELSLRKQLKPTWSWEVLSKELRAMESISIQPKYQFEDTSKLKARVWIILEENGLDVSLTLVSEDSLSRSNLRASQHAPFSSLFRRLTLWRRFDQSMRNQTKRLKTHFQKGPI